MGLISVVIPTLNEAGRIRKCLAQFQSQPGAWELIVVDGGSQDGTPQIARALGARVLSSAPGRGAQQDAGGGAASGWALLFLHADAQLPPRAHHEISKLLSDPEISAGAFQVRHLPERWASSWKSAVLRLADLRSHYSKRPYGDQGIFVRKDAFDAIGGFPPQALMEDVRFIRRLARIGRIETLDQEIQVSGRRFESGLMRAFLCMNTFPLLDRMGVRPERLQRWYGHPR